MQDERQLLPSASGAFKWYHCPASVAREPLAPEDVPSDESLLGTEIHDAIASENTAGLDDEGKTIAARLNNLEQESVAAWEQTIELPNELRDEVITEREERYWLRREDGVPLCSAKPDVTRRWRNKGWIGEIKTGWIPVAAAFQNIQLRVQAVCFWSEYPQLTHITGMLAAYRFYGGRPVVYRMAELLKARQELSFNLWRANQPDAPAVPGPWCRYCRAKAFCREAAAYSLLPVPLAKGELSKDAIFAAVAQATIEDLVFIHNQKSIIDNVQEAVDTRLKALPEDVLKEHGLRLSNPWMYREVTDVNKLWNIVHNLKLLTLEEFRACCTVKLGKVEELMIPRLLERVHEGMKKTAKDAKTVAAKLIAPAVESKLGARRLLKSKGDRDE